MITFSDSFTLQHSTKTLMERIHKDVKALQDIHVAPEDEVGVKRKLSRI